MERAPISFDKEKLEAVFAGWPGLSVGPNFLSVGSLTFRFDVNEELETSELETVSWGTDVVLRRPAETVDETVHRFTQTKKESRPMDYPEFAKAATTLRDRMLKNGHPLPHRVELKDSKGHKTSIFFEDDAQNVAINIDEFFNLTGEVQLQLYTADNFRSPTVRISA
jgi:hypothetical protein